MATGIPDQRPQIDDSALPPTRAVAFIRRLATPIWLRVGLAAVLEVPGRHTGRPLRVSVIPVKASGALYVLSFGGVTDWARNLRAAGRAGLRYKGGSETFSAIEVEGDERDRVIVAYLAGSGPVKKDFYRRPAAADHPTFRLEPLS